MNTFDQTAFINELNTNDIETHKELRQFQFDFAKAIIDGKVSVTGEIATACRARVQRFKDKHPQLL